jgi:ATP-binding cassette subfamily C protein
VLDGLSLEIPAGQLVTLVGPSGAGKTTVVDLLIGLIRPDAGSITLDGAPLDAMDIKQWRRSIGYVPQETLLLHESIAHNVSLGDSELSDEDIEHALRAAGAWDFVSALPEGMHSSVGERGGRLSGGQRQRIVIARALVRRPQLLILDEATSALDQDSADAVRQTLAQLRGALTILTITHQAGLVDIADRVYRLENGRAVLQPPAQP